MSLSLVVIWGSEELGMVAAEKHGKSSEEKSGCGENSEKQLPGGWFWSEPTHLFAREILRKINAGWDCT